LFERKPWCVTPDRSTAAEIDLAADRASQRDRVVEIA
jgi:hypothetical protein